MNACAYIVGPLEGPGAALRDLATDLRFAAVEPYRGLALADQQARKTPVCFFLFAAVADLDAIAPAAQAIRFSPGRRLRFSPLIYFAESASADTIRACVHLGFDDIVTLPFTRERVRARLGHQLDTPLVYFETPGYFGPDRRGRAPLEARDPAPHEPMGHQRRIEIIRSLKTGVTVLRDDLNAAA